MPQPKSPDESSLFIASSENSLFDFLKTDLSRDKSIHCQFPLSNENATLTVQLHKKAIASIKFSNTSKLYPPHYKPELISLSSTSELDGLLDKNLLGSDHLFCKFDVSKLSYLHRRKLRKLGTQSVSFGNGVTLYPPFK